MAVRAELVEAHLFRKERRLALRQAQGERRHTVPHANHPTHRALRGDLRCRNQRSTNWGGGDLSTTALQKGGTWKVSKPKRFWPTKLKFRKREGSCGTSILVGSEPILPLIGTRPLLSQNPTGLSGCRGRLRARQACEHFCKSVRKGQESAARESVESGLPSVGNFRSSYWRLSTPEC